MGKKNERRNGCKKEKRGGISDFKIMNDIVDRWPTNVLIFDVQ